VTRLWLVRHGEAAAHWGEELDPPLSPAGQRDARRAAGLLAAVGPLPVMASPLMRTRQTAEVIASSWATEVSIAEAVREVPSPPVAAGAGAADVLQARSQWLGGLLADRWTNQPDWLWAWRRTLLGFLAALAHPAVVVTHAVAINTVLSAARGDDRVFTVPVATGSITVVEVDPAAEPPWAIVAVGVRDAATIII
jgi:broad specificity phosphatase PhoE